MTKRFSRSSASLIISIIALIAAVGGTSYAAFKLPKNSVGSKQLKKNAVTTKKIKNGAVTAKKINTNGLVVPEALHASSASSATTAGSASSATTAGTANQAHNIDAPENIHIIGAPGQPAFQNGCSDAPTQLQPAGFWKDKEGVVHLQGAYQCPSTTQVAFQLPGGYQPATGTAVSEAAPCDGCSSAGIGSLLVTGPGISGFPAGAVVISATEVDMSGITFRPGA